MTGPQRAWGETLRADLGRVLNKYSCEQKSSTPDYVLAEYLQDCLAAYDKAVNARRAFFMLGDERDGRRPDQDYVV